MYKSFRELVCYLFSMVKHTNEILHHALTAQGSASLLCVVFQMGDSYSTVR